MREMLGWAAERGFTREEGEILSENKRMLRLARAVGTKVRAYDRDVGTVRVAIDLPPAAEASAPELSP